MVAAEAERYVLNVFSMIIMKGLNTLRSVLYFSVDHKTGCFSYGMSTARGAASYLYRQRSNTMTIKFGLGCGEATLDRPKPNYLYIKIIKDIFVTRNA